MAKLSYPPKRIPALRMVFDPEMRATKTFTKVVTQFVQFLGENRAGDDLIEQADMSEEEELAESEAF